MLLILSLVLLHEYPSLTIISFLMLTMFQLVHLKATGYTFQATSSNRLDMLGECTLYLASLSQLASLSAFNQSSYDLQEELDAR